MGYQPNAAPRPAAPGYFHNRSNTVSDNATTHAYVRFMQRVLEPDAGEGASRLVRSLCFRAILFYAAERLTD